MNRRFVLSCLLALGLIGSVADAGLITQSGAVYTAPAAGLTASGVSGTIEEGQIVRVSALGAESFGATGPEITFYANYKNDTVGQAFSTANVEGNGTISNDGTQGYNLVVENSALPFGRGILVGLTTAGAGQYRRARVDFPERTYEIFEMKTYFFTEGINYEGAGGSGAQIKPLWYMDTLEGDSSSTLQDFMFCNVQAGSRGAFIAGNDNAANYGVMNDLAGANDQSGLTAPPPSSTIRKGRAIQFAAWFQGNANPGEQTGNDGHYYLLDPNEGFRFNVSAADNIVAWHTGRARGVTLFTYPGYVEVWTEADYPIYFAESYIAAGPGAPARVMVTDAEVFDDSTKWVMWIVEDQADWTAEYVDVRVELGIFHQLGLENAYIHAWDANNTHVFGGTGRLIQ